MGAARAAASFAGGLAMTFVMVVIVPVIVETYVTGVIEDLVGDNTLLYLTSDTIVTVLVFGVMLAFMYFLGAGGVVRRCGLYGAIGLVVVYWLLGDVTEAIVPVIMMAVTVAYEAWKERREEKSRMVKDIRRGK